MPGLGIRAFIEALDQPTLLLEADVLQFANEAARKLLGDPIEGSNVRLAIRHPQALEQILASATGDSDITGVGEFGRPWTLSIRKVDDGMLLVRLIDRSAALAAEKMRVDFVANASHELRTPLATVIGYSETLTEEADLDATLCARFGATIRDEAKRMLRIIEDLMSLSRIEAGRFVAPSEPVMIGGIVMSAVDNARRLPGTCKCKIEMEIDDSLPQIVGDQQQLMQLLDNLLSNAIRYACQLGGCAIRVAASSSEGHIRLLVSDNGPGIPPEHLRRVTERFYRVDPARSRESGGTGLGLAIVKHIIERHKGTLDIRSKVGEGTEVVVRLPVAL